ncbi:MAG: tRNA epoxyqueuosine(34) reductase QueG [Rhizobacter sp.]|nr:tRNA epoxyqueuosine(34) reductase QueG [Chlorobiales bacterium]
MTATEKIKQRALALGFSRVGIAKAERLDAEAVRLEAWLRQGRHGEMTYMQENFEKRVDPSALIPNAKSIISVIGIYSLPILGAVNEVVDGESEFEKPTGKISAYAARLDYHTVMKGKLQTLFQFVCETVGEVNGRAFVDSAPMLDKAWAQRAGLGWIGKHSNLLNRTLGSAFFIGSLVLDAVLEYDAPYLNNYCGDCTACIDLCPTEAITEPYQVDARKCISYLTIELKRNFTEEESNMVGEWLFGCDICQQVCPWNRFAATASMNGLETLSRIENVREDEILEMTTGAFKRIFAETPVHRTGLRRLKRNAEAVKRNGRRS